jgi:hypothetical protein
MVMGNTARRDFLKRAPAAAGAVASIAGVNGGAVAGAGTSRASSQQTADLAAHIDFADLGRLHGDDKDFPRRVRAIRAI